MDILKSGETIFTPQNIIIYLVIINIITFLIMAYDKHEAKVGHWRISEKALFLFCIIGGSVGGIFGMYVFRHKTQKSYFKFGFPLILIIQIVLIIMFFIK